MIVCPLCEHQQQQGTVCEVCGKELVASQSIGVVTEMLADLESTALVGTATTIPIERMADLDEHRAAAVQPPPVSMPELEQTRQADAGAVAATGALPDIEPTRFADDGQRTPLSATRTCRYCGNVQQGGVLCDRCGLRLPGAEFERRAPKQSEDPEPIPCPACSVKGFPGARCRSCGAYIRVPEL